MGHPNILTLVDYFETVNNLYLVTDLALGGELFDRICRKGSYFEPDAADVVKQIVSAVAYIHDHGIVHRDLKPENLLFRMPEDNADILIADFGLSRIIEGNGEVLGDLLEESIPMGGYCAPETFKPTGHGKPVDMWAIGMITYFLLCGLHPLIATVTWRRYKRSAQQTTVSRQLNIGGVFHHGLETSSSVV